MFCNRCKKRVAIIFFPRTDGKETKTEGICLVCAKEIGLKPVDDIMSRMGINEENIESVSEEINDLAEKGWLPFQQINPAQPNDGEGGNDDIFGNGNFFNIMKSEFPFSEFNDDETPKKSSKFSGNSKEEKEKKNAKRKNLELYCTNLNKRAEEGKLDRIIGRTREIERVIQILCRRQKNNPCLIGEPGVGKTAIAEALAIKITAGDVPFKLRDKEIHLLDLTSLVAGTQFRGQFESRMKGLIDEVKKLGNIILVIDEVHTIVGAGDAEGSMNAANILKPSLSRGDIQVIGATTLNEYRQYIEKDSALERRFQPIIIKEPSIADSVEMLKGIKGYYEKFHGVKVNDDILKQTVVLSERYITDRFLPDKAIDLLDEACAYVALNSHDIEKYRHVSLEIEKLTEQIEKIESGDEMPSDSSQSAEIYHKLADMKVQKLNMVDEASMLRGKIETLTVSIEDLAHVIEKWTNIPANNISENEFERLNGLENRLKMKIIGQDEAVDAVVRAVKRSRVGIAPKRKPVSFIFAGPTGVGKTELVKTLAADLFDSPESLIRLDMSEFMEKFAVSRIIGAPPGYVGYDESGQLTEKIRRKPYSVVLFDEIEKAHPDVMNILLQILDDGKITDSHGREVNFENTIIVMTTNAGSNLNMASIGFTENANKAFDNKTQKALSDFLRPEFLNRIDEIITFRALDEDNFTEIAKLMLNELKSTLEEKSLGFKYTHESAQAIAKTAFSKKYGARNIRRLIQTEVEDKMAAIIIEKKTNKNIIFSLSTDENGKLFVAGM